MTAQPITHVAAQPAALPSALSTPVAQVSAPQASIASTLTSAQASIPTQAAPANPGFLKRAATKLRDGFIFIFTCCGLYRKKPIVAPVAPPVPNGGPLLPLDQHLRLPAPLPRLATSGAPLEWQHRRLAEIFRLAHASQGEAVINSSAAATVFDQTSTVTATLPIPNTRLDVAINRATIEIGAMTDLSRAQEVLRLAQRRGQKEPTLRELVEARHASRRLQIVAERLDPQHLRHRPLREAYDALQTNILNVRHRDSIEERQRMIQFESQVDALRLDNADDILSAQTLLQTLETNYPPTATYTSMTPVQGVAVVLRAELRAFLGYDLTPALPLLATASGHMFATEFMLDRLEESLPPPQVSSNPTQTARISFTTELWNTFIFLITCCGLFRRRAQPAPAVNPPPAPPIVPLPIEQQLRLPAQLPGMAMPIAENVYIDANRRIAELVRLGRVSDGSNFIHTPATPTAFAPSAAPSAPRTPSATQASEINNLLIKSREVIQLAQNRAQAEPRELELVAARNLCRRLQIAAGSLEPQDVRHRPLREAYDALLASILAIRHRDTLEERQRMLQFENQVAALNLENAADIATAQTLLQDLETRYPPTATYTAVTPMQRLAIGLRGELRAFLGIGR